MSTFKKTTKSKVRTEEDESFIEEFFDEPPVKKFKVDQDIEASGELRHKILNIMNRQLQAWKQNNDTFMKDLNKIITNLEADYKALKNNVQKVEQLNGYIVKYMQQVTAACKEKVEAVRAIFSAFKNEKQNNDTFMKDLNKIITNLEADHEALKNDVQKVEQLNGYIVKRMQQATAACNEKVEAVRAILSAFKNDCEEIGDMQKAEINKLGNELDEDIQNLKQKLIADTKRMAKKNLEKSFFQALQNNFK